ncbi:MAG TPA: lysophospholipid acyltransferase family protein [Oleiagrimonas sp.]|nr:lysophospholipid acyltransferase family protein [Oleiagrimonas sp.]
MTIRQQHANTVAEPGRTRLRPGRLWRVFGTGLCFVLYGSLAWMAGLTVLPLLLLWPGSRTARQRRIRGFVGATFRGLLALITILGLGRVEVEGRQWLHEAGGKLLVANHPMYLDVVALVGLLPQADCVVKQAMWRNRLYRRFVRTIGYIGNACQGGLLNDCVETLQRGQPLILFPEGTRSTPGRPVHFHRGAAQVAVRSGCQILPVVIRCEPLALGKQQAWHEVPTRPWTLHVRICPPCTLADLDGAGNVPYGVAARHVNRALEARFARELSRSDVPGESLTPEPETSAARQADAHA